MTIEVDIIPTTNKTITWIALKSQLLLSSLSDDAALLLGCNPKLLRLGTSQELTDEQVFLPMNHYSFQLARDNTLGLCCDNNAETYTNEQEYIEDFGRNLNFELRLLLSRSWEKVGYGYAVSSMGGRTTGELSLLIAIVTLIARLSDGFVLVKDNGVFSLPIGC